MTLKEVKQNAFHKYSNHKGYSWIIGLTFGLISAGLLLLFLYFLYDAFILSLITVFPLFFASTISHRNMTHKREPSIKKTGLFFFSFFKGRFRGVFKCWWSLLKSLAVFFVMYIILGFIFYEVWKGQSLTFEPTLNQIISLYLNGEIYEENSLNVLLNANNYELLKYFTIVETLSLVPTALVFVFFICKEQISIINRNELGAADHRFLNLLERNVVKHNRKDFYKLYFGLNWPLFILLLIGMAVGVTLSFVFFDPNNYPFAFSLSIGVGLASFFLPFYFNNNEAIHDAFMPYYEKGSKDLASDMLERLTNDAKLNEEEKAMIDEQMEKLRQMEQTTQEEKDKEKDPPSES